MPQTLYQRDTGGGVRCVMRGVGYRVPTDDSECGNTLVYMLVHKGREAAQSSWRAFGGDPDWATMRGRVAARRSAGCCRRVDVPSADRLFAS